MLKNLGRLLVIAIFGTTISLAAPHQALASDEYPCSGGTYLIDANGVVSNLSSCTGNLLLAPAAKSFSGYVFGTELTSITLPASFNVSSEDVSFWNFSSLTEWKVDSTNQNLTTLNGALYSKDLSTLFSYPATKTGSFTAPSTLKTVGAGAFRNSKLTKIDLSFRVENIARDSFYNSSVEELNLSAELKSVANLNWQLDQLKKLTIDEANSSFKLMGGNLLSKDGKTFWLSPAATLAPVCQIPDGVETLETYSLTRNSCSSITLPDSLKTIKSFSFFSTFNKEIKIPTNVEIIQDYPFSGSYYLESITVDSKNTNFKAIDGVLYDSDISRLIHFPESKNVTQFTIPKTVTAELPYLGHSRYVLDFLVEKGSTNYKSIDGVVYDIQGEILYGYPGGRTDKSYIFPDTIKKILDGAIVNSSLSLLISTEDPNLIDTTTTGFTILDAKTGLARLDAVFKETVTELNDRLASSKNNSDGEIKVKDEQISSIQDDLTKVQAALNSVHDGGFYRTQLCDGGVMTITFDGRLTRASLCKGEVDVPNFVESIDKYAFYENKAMTKLNIPASVEKFDANFFDGTTSLTEIYVDPKNKKFSSVDGVLFNKEKTQLVLYPSGKAADKYVVPSSVKTLNYSAFVGAKVKEVVLPPELDSINAGTFTKSEIQTINIPKSFAGWISSSAFNQANNLTAINVATGNQSYFSKEGVLYSLDGKSLIRYPIAKSGTSFVVPEGVESIETSAFEFTSLTSILLPSTLKTLGFSAFGESKIERLAIPANTQISESYQFFGLKSVKSISIDPANESATVKEGVIYSKDLTKIIYFPSFLETQSFTIPTNVKEIDISAFVGSSLKELSFTSDLKNLSFLGWWESKIETINISASFVSFSEDLFDYAPNIKYINVDPNNANFSSVEGILFNKGKTKLIRIPVQHPTLDYVVPDSVEQLSEGALYNNQNISKIVFGPKVTSIPGLSLAYGYALQRIDVDSLNPIYTSRDGILYNKTLTQLEAFPQKFPGKTLTLPLSLVTLNPQAFISGPNLETLHIPASLDSIDSWRFNLDALKLLIYDGKDPRVSKNLFLYKSVVPRIMTSAELAAEETKTAQDEKLKSDLKKAEESARIEAEAKIKAEAESKVAKDAQLKAEAEVKAAIDARVVAETALRALTAKVTTTITCIKGKSTKKVTGVLPICPKGYTKK